VTQLLHSMQRSASHRNFILAMVDSSL